MKTGGAFTNLPLSQFIAWPRQRAPFYNVLAARGKRIDSGPSRTRNRAGIQMSINLSAAAITHFVDPEDPTIVSPVAEGALAGSI
jgi:hypothetical protein